MLPNHDTHTHLLPTLLSLTLLYLFALPLLSHNTYANPRRSKTIVISGLYFDGYLKGNPEPEESIRITNLTSRTIDVSNWIISDRFLLPRTGQNTSQQDDPSYSRRTRRSRKSRRSRRTRRSRARSSRKRRGPPGEQTIHNLILPSGTRIPPKSSIWIAHQADAFKRFFGRYPHVEGKDTTPNVPNARMPNGWPNFWASHGIVSIHNANGETIDVLCYVRDTRIDNLNKQNVPEGHWLGSSILLKGANTYSWTGQILSRDRDGKGSFVPDTNSAHDWNSSFSLTQLGQDPTHRVERPGQSHFQLKYHRNVRAEVLVTSAPENNYKALTNAFRNARKEILINIYQFTNRYISDVLIKARKRGVKITILMEGSPVGGVQKKSRWIAEQLTKAGAKILWMRGRISKKRPRRYRFNHAKYAIIDRKWVIIGTENYGTTGHPLHPSFGNRGWEVHVRSPLIVNTMLAVFRQDTNTTRFHDLLPYSHEAGRWGALPTNTTLKPRKIKRGHYAYRRKPLRVKGRMNLQIVLSPDNSLHEKSSLIGSILRCKTEVLALQNSIPLYWGKKNFRSFKKTPDLPLSALIKAARKGCRVRVLLDSTWYHIRTDNPRSNDNTVWMINHIAAREHLDLQAKLVNLDSIGISKIHAKGLIIDRKETFIGSINWTENSFKGNREVGIIIKHPKIAKYYADLFMYDWIRSRIYQVVVRRQRAPVYKTNKVTSRILRNYSFGDPIDILAEVGDFFQVRLNERLIGYLHKGPHYKLMSSFEARFQIGASGIVHGRIFRVRQRPRMAILFLQAPHKQGLNIVLWRSTIQKLTRSLGGDLQKKLMGKYIQVKGKITTYRGSPQVILRDPSQLSIIEEE